VRFPSLIALLACFSVEAQAAAPVHLVPSTPWIVDYAENSCRLVRRFGEGNDTTTLAFESEAPGSLDILIIGRPLGTSSDEVAVKFLPLRSKAMTGEVHQTVQTHAPSVLVNSVQLASGDFVAAQEKRISAFNVRQDAIPGAIRLEMKAAYRAERDAFVANTTAVEIDVRHPLILDTGPLGPAMKRFDQCGRDSLRDWGVDPDVEDQIARPVWAPDPSKWFDPSDYPAKGISLNHESVVKVRLLVDAAGRPTKCTSLSHFDDPEFNKVTCEKFMSRAHFAPAELADGTKVPSYFVIKVTYRMAQ
jgi:hypothetical protein